MDLPNITSTLYSHQRTQTIFLNTFYEHSKVLCALECGVKPVVVSSYSQKIGWWSEEKLWCFRAAQAETHSLPEVSDIMKFSTAEWGQIEDANLHMPQSSFRTNNYVRPSTSKPFQQWIRFTSPSSQKASFPCSNSQ